MNIHKQRWLVIVLLISGIALHGADDEKDNHNKQPWGTSIFFNLPLELQYKISAYVLGGDIKNELFRPILLRTIQRPKKSLSFFFNSSLNYIAFNPNNSQIVTAEKHAVNIWDITTAQLVHTLQKSTNNQFGGAQAVAFNRQGDRIACASHDNTLRIYDAITNKEISSSENHENLLCALTFSPNGTEIVCSDVYGNLHLHNSLTNQKIHTFKGNKIRARSVVFNSKGSLVAIADLNKTVHVFDAVTYQEIDTLPHKHFLLSVAFHPHEDWIASGCADHYVYLWNRSTKKIIHTCKHNDWVFSVAFSPDGSVIASGSHDKTVRIWDTITGKQLRILENLAGVVDLVTFNQDGSLLASASKKEGIVHIWDTLSEYKKYVRDIDLEQVVWICHEYQTAMQADAQQQNCSNIPAEEKKEQIIRKLAIEHSITPEIVSRLGALKALK